MSRPHVYSGGRYPVLRSLAIFYLISGALMLLAGLVTAGWALMRAPGAAADRIILAVAALVATFFLVITMLAIAELVKLFIDVEHNTRMTAARTIDASLGQPGPAGNRMNSYEEESAEAALLRGH